MSEYREGNEPDPTPKAEAPEETEGRPAPKEWFGQGAGDPATLPGPDPESDPENAEDPSENPGRAAGEQVYTAVLLVQLHNGVVTPITNLKGLVDVHHMANPHEVLRMTADVMHQISAMRTIGETARTTHEIVDRGVKLHNQGQLSAFVQLVKPLYDHLGVPFPGEEAAGGDKG